MKDLTVVAIPLYFGSMGAEYLWLRNRDDELSGSAGLYERRDTVASLTMGVGSLLGPLVLPKLLSNVVPGKGKYGKALVTTALGAAAVTTLADLLVRRDERARAPGGGALGGAGTDSAQKDNGEAANGEPLRNQTASAASDDPAARSAEPLRNQTASAASDDPAARSAGRATAAGEVATPDDDTPRSEGAAGRRRYSDSSRRARSRMARAARPVASAGGVVAIIAGGLAVTTTWASRTSMNRLARRRFVRKLGTGPPAVAAAVFAWDFIYYWNHRAMHESRFMWAIHVVHHSSERYNLSTALRQPVAEAFGTFLPYSALTLLGFEPALVNTARGVNLIYQFWIHTETVDKIGRLERILNTPSHHRVHHGRNGPYLDRNHGSILIVWDKLFGTFEPEGDRVVYGLTKNINTFNPARIAGHEYREMLRDVARSRTWSDRLGFVLRGPGWAGRRRIEQLAERGEVRRPETGDVQSVEHCVGRTAVA